MRDWETFQLAYQNASTEIKIALDSGSITNLIVQLLPNLDNNSRRLVTKVMSEYVLELVTIPELINFLAQNSIQVDEAMVNKIALGTISTQSLSPVNSVRTMAGDMQTARGEQMYSSNQDALLQANQTPTDPDVARWQQTQ